MSLTKGEKETVIRFDEADDTATVYTCSKRIMHRLNVLSQKTKEVVLISEDKYSKTYKLPQKMVGFKMKRVLADATLEKYRQHGQKLGATRRAKTNQTT